MMLNEYIRSVIGPEYIEQAIRKRMFLLDVIHEFLIILVFYLLNFYFNQALSRTSKLAKTVSP